MQTFTIAKSATRSREGLVVASNRHAAEAGAAVLRRGGNAMDAAVTTALMLSVVEPWLSGVGGGGFLAHGSAATGAVTTLNFNMVAPAGLDPADYPLAEGSVGNWFEWPAVVGERNIHGYGSIAVPGAVAGFAEALASLGTIGFAEAVQPAIEAAERGLEIDWWASLSLAQEAANLAVYPATAALLLDGGRAPTVGDGRAPTLKPMPAKAAMLKRLAKAGPRDFYEGETARLLVADLQAGGSRIDADDLARTAPVWSAALTQTYGRSVVHALPGLSGGPSFLEALRDVIHAGLTPQTPLADALATYAAAVRAAYGRRLATMGHGAPRVPECTTHVSVVDAKGDMVALTNTLLARFGSRVTLPQTGLLMNNGIMWFDPRPGTPNAIAPGRQPLANMCPVIVTEDGKPKMAIGAAGGRTIFPTVLQILSGVVDGGLDLETAFHRPRLDASTATIKVDRRAGPEAVAKIGESFPVEAVDDVVFPTSFAIPAAVMREGDGGFVGMAQPGSPWAAAVAP